MPSSACGGPRESAVTAVALQVQRVGYPCQIMWLTICCRSISAAWGQGNILLIQYGEFWNDWPRVQLYVFNAPELVIAAVCSELKSLFWSFLKWPIQENCYLGCKKKTSVTQQPTATGASVLPLLTSTSYGSRSISCECAVRDPLDRGELMISHRRWSEVRRALIFHLCAFVSSVIIKASGSRLWLCDLHRQRVRKQLV